MPGNSCLVDFKLTLQNGNERNSYLEESPVGSDPDQENSRIDLAKLLKAEGLSTEDLHRTCQNIVSTVLRGKILNSQDLACS